VCLLDVDIDIYGVCDDLDVVESNNEIGDQADREFHVLVSLHRHVGICIINIGDELLYGAC
jgi:hypothetical protein